MTTPTLVYTREWVLRQWKNAGDQNVQMADLVENFQGRLRAGNVARRERGRDPHAQHSRHRSVRCRQRLVERFVERFVERLVERLVELTLWQSRLPTRSGPRRRSTAPA